jgi:hypothetical protein
MGSWEVHSDVGQVSAGEGTSRGGVLSPVGGMGRGAVLGCFGCRRGGSGCVTSIFRLVTPTGSGPSWWCTGARGGWYLCVVAVLRFRCWISHEHILQGGALTSWALLSL